MHCILIALLFKTDMLKSLLNSIGITHPPEISQTYKDMVGFHSRVDQNLDPGAAIFIGDSLVQGLAVSAVSPHGVNYGIGHDTTYGVLTRLEKYRSIRFAKVVMISVGINDLKRRDPDEAINNYRKILMLVPKNIQVIVNAVLPIDEKVKQARGRTNKRVKELNVKLEALVKKHANAVFLDISRQLKDRGSDLAAKYHIGDGVHLNSKGYQVWITALKQEINKLPSRHELFPESAGLQ